MKYLGFLKQIDKYRSESKDLVDMLKGNSLESSQRLLIIDYLSRGHFFLGWMTFLRDDDGSPIGNNDYFTDGCYVWPSYFIYYLRKFEDLEIDKDFISHVKANNFVVPYLSKEELSNIQSKYLNDR